MQKILWLQRFLCCIALGAMTISALPASAASEWAYEIVSPPKNIELEAGKLQRFSLELRNVGSESWDENVSLVIKLNDKQGRAIEGVKSHRWQEKTRPGERSVFLAMMPKMLSGTEGVMEIDLKHATKGLFSAMSGGASLTVPFVIIPKSHGFLLLLTNAILVCAILWLFSPSVFRRMPKVKKLWEVSKYPLVAMGIFFVSRVVVFLGFATKFLYKSTESVNGDFFGYMINLLGRAWDGGWYLRILSEGYFFIESKGSSIAFYPLYPLISRVFAKAFGIPSDVALLLVSNMFSFLAVIALYKLFEHLTRDPQKALVGITFFSVFPASLFLSVAYAESMFIFLVATSLLLMLKFKKVVPAYSIAALALVTKVPGIFLFPTFFCSAFTKSGKRWVFDKQKLIWLPIILVPYALFLLYSKIKFGTFLAPFLAQEAWHGKNIYGMTSIALKKIRELFDFSLADMLGNQRIFFENSRILKQLSLYECFSFMILCLILAGIITFWKRLDRVIKLWCVFLTVLFLTVYTKSMMGFGAIGRFFLYYFPMFFVASFLNIHIRNILIMLFTAMLFFLSFLFILKDVFVV